MRENKAPPNEKERMYVIERALTSTVTKEKTQNHLQNLQLATPTSRWSSGVFGCKEVVDEISKQFLRKGTYTASKRL